MLNGAKSMEHGKLRRIIKHLFGDYQLHYHSIYLPQMDMAGVRTKPAFEKISELTSCTCKKSCTEECCCIKAGLNVLISVLFYNVLILL